VNVAELVTQAHINRDPRSPRFVPLLSISVDRQRFSLLSCYWDRIREQ
jgi:hypothetical protein